MRYFREPLNRTSQAHHRADQAESQAWAQPERIGEVDRIAGRVPVEVEPSGDADGVFLGESAGLGIVPADSAVPMSPCSLGATCSILLSMYTVYLDACCLNRPFDDQTQDRIRLEAEAVLLILGHVERDEWRWIGSEVLDFEVVQNPDAERRRRVQVLLRSAAESVPLDDTVMQRGTELEGLGFGAFDALHLACAEGAGVDVFLTTDDGLLRRAHRLTNQIRVRVENPLTWLRERSES